MISLFPKNNAVKVAACLLCFVLFPVCLRSQILPAEGGKLNYRLIGFSFPAQEKTGHYKIEIAAGNYNNNDSFERHIIKAEHATANKKIIEVPYFGREYTWRAVCKGVPPAAVGGLHHFSTKTVPYIDTT